MTLYSAPACLYCQRTRIVLAEKGIEVDIIYIDESTPLPQDLIDIYARGSVPVLVDRDVVLYDSRVIMEYLDERYPHPPLLPVDPVARAKIRLMLYHIDQDWYAPLKKIEHCTAKEAAQTRKLLGESMTASVRLFTALPFFMSRDFGLADCCLAPLLWRLPHYGVELPAQAKPIWTYADRSFARPSFRSSLTDIERAMRA